MNGVWIASYAALWLVVAVLTIVVIGMLRQIGILQQSNTVPKAGTGNKPSIEDDGPAVGSRMLEFHGESINGFGLVSSSDTIRRGATLLVFMSPLCEGCQHAAEALSAPRAEGDPSLVVIMRADMRSSLAFLSVFPLHAPMVCDEDRAITLNFGVHRSPFALLYDERGVLVRKGTATAQEDLRALLGDTSAPEVARAHVFPPLQATDEASRVGVKL